MNTIGRKFRISVYGESHGSGIGVVIDGMPSGVKFEKQALLDDLNRRKPCAIGTTNRKESDDPKIISGIFNGFTTGSPICINFNNSDTIEKDYDQSKPRPGHADFTSYIKFNGYNDYRGGGHFSGRLTLALVTAGYFARQILKDIKFCAYIIDEKSLQKKIQAAIENNDSVGAVIECKISGLPVGLGEPFFDSVESVISHIIFSIPGIKGIEFGAGFNSANMFGSEMNDEITDLSGKTKTNNAGGINGGISNGNDIIFRVAVKPTSSIGQTQSTIDLSTGEQKSINIKGRHDACFALRTPVIVEAASAIALADFLLLNI